MGTQGTVLGGGRYDGLSEMLGGPHIPAVGFAAGVDRLVMMNKLKNDLPVAISIIPIQKENFDHCYSLMNTLRNNNIRAEIHPGGNVSKYLKKINKKNQKIVILVGDKEIENKKVVLKNLSTGDQFEVQNEELIKKINMQSD